MLPEASIGSQIGDLSIRIGVVLPLVVGYHSRDFAGAALVRCMFALGEDEEGEGEEKEKRERHQQSRDQRVPTTKQKRRNDVTNQRKRDRELAKALSRPTATDVMARDAGISNGDGDALRAIADGQRQTVAHSNAPIA